MYQSRLLVWACIGGLFVWLFAAALLGGGMFAFRDAAHFYYPLFQFISDEWANGRLPLWNPYENLGQPLAADAASSVFYPGKLVFVLPLAYAWRYKLYILGHVLLAAYAAYRLARHWKTSVAAGGVCAISYAFSGNVLFNYCNVVFLVGAAWLPLGLLAADRMLLERSWHWAVAFAAVLALMTLGGDPQMAYNAGLLAALYAVVLWGKESPLALWDALRKTSPLALWERVRVRAEGGPGDKEISVVSALSLSPRLLVSASSRPSPLVPRPCLLALAAAAAFVLASVQVLPSLEFVRYSTRHTGSIGARLLGRLEPDSHAENTYQFSVGPWRLAEYLWPNVAGRQFPIHRRWLAAIPAEGRTWTPSLYMGLLPLLLALGALRWRRAGPVEMWLSWAAVLSVAASFGWFGLGWLGHEIQRASGGPPQVWPVGAPFGGLYWLMTLILPGYAYFRYPAKLLVVAALALSVLSARGWDRIFDGPAARFRRGLLWLGGLSLCGGIIVFLGRPLWQRWLVAAEPDVLFGPLDVAGALGDVRWALLQTAVLCGAFWWLLRSAIPRPPSPVPLAATVSEPVGRTSVTKQRLALLLIVVDLAVANGWMIVCAPANQWEQMPALVAALTPGPSPTRAAAARGRGESSSVPPRVYRHPLWLRPEWESSASPTRVAEAMRWDRDTLWPKYNLRPRIAIAEVEGTMMLEDYATYLAAAADLRGACEAVGADFAILPANEVLPGGDRVQVAGNVGDVSLWRDPHPLPRAWIVHGKAEGETGTGDRGQGRGKMIANCKLQIANCKLICPLLTAPPVCSPGANCLLSTACCLLSSALRPPPSALPPAESCRVVHYDPLCVKIEATLGKPGLVVLGDQFYPGWQLAVETDRQPARSMAPLRTNRVMRGAWLPAGEHRLTYRYRPASFLWGAALSGMGWLVLGVMHLCFALQLRS